MTTLLDALLADLDAESDALRELVDELGADGWHTATPAAGWSVATQIAHLAWTDRTAVTAAHARADQASWDALVTLALEDPTGFVDAEALRLAERPREEVLAEWADARAGLRAALSDYPAGERMPWFGPPMSPTSMATARFMETWAHALDVQEAVGRIAAPTDRIRHVTHLGVRTRDFSYAVHGRTPPAEEFRFELTAPSGELWAWGPEDAAQRITGSAHDFCLLVTQRRHRDDTDLVATGADAEHWLSIAQCFAGPPGEGRSAS